MRIDFVTIFPRMFDPFLAEGVIARGVKQGALDIRVWDLRDFAADRHRSTDDEAYGGGPGMVMLAEPVLRCVEAIRVGAAALGRPAAGGAPAATLSVATAPTFATSDGSGGACAVVVACAPSFFEQAKIVNATISKARGLIRERFIGS